MFSLEIKSMVICVSQTKFYYFPRGLWDQLPNINCFCFFTTFDIFVMFINKLNNN